MKKYLILTLVIAISAGMILPLALGVKDPSLIAITFGMVWFIYGALLLITTFLIKRGLKIKASRQEGVTVVRYELPDAEKEK
jgi:hypothetical protein